MIRDPKTKALLNTDIEALNKYKLERSQQREVQRLSRELEEVKKVLRRVCDHLEKIEKV